MRNIILCLLLLSSLAASYVGAFGVSIIDDILMLAACLLSVAYFFSAKNISNQAIFRWVALIAIFEIGIFTCFYYKREIVPIDFFIFFKYTILFEIILLLKITHKECKKYISAFLYAQIPNLICALFQLAENFSSLMEFRIEDGTFVRESRVDAFAGHAASFGALCSIIITIYLFKQRNRFDKVMLILWGVALLSSLSRNSLAVTLCGAVVYMISAKIISLKSFALLCVFLLMSLGLFLFSDLAVFFRLWMEAESGSTVRFWSWTAAVKALENFTFFGVGIGAFGTPNSFLFNYGAYNELGINASRFYHYALDRGNVLVPFSESQWAMNLVQVGVVGSLLFYCYYFSVLISCVKHKNILAAFLLGQAILLTMISRIEMGIISMMIVSNANTYNSKNIYWSKGK